MWDKEKQRRLLLKDADLCIGCKQPVDDSKNYCQPALSASWKGPGATEMSFLKRSGSQERRPAGTKDSAGYGRESAPSVKSLLRASSRPVPPAGRTSARFSANSTRERMKTGGWREMPEPRPRVGNSRKLESASAVARILLDNTQSARAAARDGDLYITPERRLGAKAVRHQLEHGRRARRIQVFGTEADDSQLFVCLCDGPQSIRPLCSVKRGS